MFVWPQVFGGFASHELAVRIDDAAPKVVVSASCGLEGADRVLEYKPLLDAALDMAEHKPEACLMWVAVDAECWLSRECPLTVVPCPTHPQPPAAAGDGIHGRWP